KCGNKCPYCFQNHTQRQDTSLFLVERFLELLERRLAEQPPVPLLFLILFGGEPIRRDDLCLFLLKGARKICERHNVKLAAYLAANGILEQEGNLLPLKNEGLLGIQVTFDGPGNVHQKTRGNTYRKAMKMLPYYSKMFYLSLKYNLTKESGTRENISTFLDDLVNSGVPAGTLVVPEAVVPTLTYNDTEVIFPHYAPELPAVFLQFFKMALERSFRCTLSSAFHPPCFLRRKNVLEIQPDGYVTVCENGYGLNEFLNGNIE
ncbi:MAG: radical SAM protein, partial [bacterium]|nr:radical SAM protein [bacterium]